MPQPLPIEELQQLETQLPNFRESPHLQYLAERKLLPQQNDMPSFENPDFLTGLRRHVFGLTRKEQQLGKRQEEALVPFQQEQELKTKLQALHEFAMANAPTYGEANARGFGIPAPMQSVPQTFPGSAELPGTFNIDELQPGPMVGMTPSRIQFGAPGSQVGIPIREAPTYAPTTIPFDQPNPSGKLSPTDLKLYEQMVGGQGVMQEGRYIPMPLAKLPGSMLEPKEANAYLESVGVPLLKPFTEPVSASMITELVRQQRGEGQPQIIKLQEQKNRLEAIPPAQRTSAQQAMLDTVTHSIEKLNRETPETDLYTNVQPDGQGGFIGLRKATGRIEQIPMAASIKGVGQLSPEARSAAAQRYLIDGTLPPNLGRGMQGAANTTAILNEASTIAAAQGLGGEAQRIQQLANKSASSALTQLSAQEAKLSAFEKTFQKNLDLAKTLSTKVHRIIGVPIFDAWVQAGQRAVTGDPDITALDVAVKSVVNEFARITTSASGSGQNTAEGEINKIEGLLKAAQTPKQFQAVLNTMRTETQNRIEAFAEQKAQIRRSMGAAGRATPEAPALPSMSEIDAELARRQSKGK